LDGFHFSRDCPWQFLGFFGYSDINFFGFGWRFRVFSDLDLFGFLKDVRTLIFQGVWILLVFQDVRILVVFSGSDLSGFSGVWISLVFCRIRIFRFSVDRIVLLLFADTKMEKIGAGMKLFRLRDGFARRKCDLPDERT